MNSWKSTLNAVLCAATYVANFNVSIHFGELAEFSTESFGYECHSPSSTRKRNTANFRMAFVISQRTV